MINYQKISHKVFTSIIVLLSLLLGLSDISYSFTWEVDTPENQGMNKAKLDAMWNNLSARSTKVLLIVRNDKIVYEKYNNWTRTKKHYSASMDKAFVGGLSYMVVRNDGLIGPTDYARQYVPQWVGVYQKNDIQVRHLLTHTSGIEDANQDQAGDDVLPYEQWEDDFWQRLDPPNDPFTISRDIAPMISAPGTAKLYSNAGMAMFSYCITAALRNLTYKDIRNLIKYRIMMNIGITDTEWECGYNKTFTVDGLPLVASWGGGRFSPNASARIGRLMLKRGNWDGVQLISSGIVDEVTSHAGTLSASGMGWWINKYGDGSKKTATLPSDAYWGYGSGNQITLIIPSLNMIVVRNGDRIEPNDQYIFTGFENHLFAPLMDSVYGVTKHLVDRRVSPCRVVDTRLAGGAIPPGGIRSYNVYGHVASQGGNPSGCPSPNGEPLAVALNVTAVPLSGTGHLTAYPFGTTTPLASLVNYKAGAQNVANSGTVKTCFNCTKDISVKSGVGTTHVVIDVLGYYYPKP